MVTDANEMTDRTSPTDPCDFKVSCITYRVSYVDGNAAEVIMYTLYIKI